MYTSSLELEELNSAYETEKKKGLKKNLAVMKDLGLKKKAIQDCVGSTSVTSKEALLIAFEDLFAKLELALDEELLVIDEPNDSKVDLAITAVTEARDSLILSSSDVSFNSDANVSPPPQSRFTVNGLPVELHDSVSGGPGIHFGSVREGSRLLGELVQLVLVKEHSSARDVPGEWALLLRLAQSSWPEYFPEPKSFGAATSQSPPYLVVARFGQDLRGLMNGRSDNFGTRKLVMIEVFKALEALHKLGYMHGDLKPANVLYLVSGDGSIRVKLCDFDSARRADGQQLFPADAYGRPKGTEGWLAPEVATAVGPVAAALTMDLFCMGLLLELMLRETCLPRDTVVPTDRTDPNCVRALTDEGFFRSLLQCRGRSHEQLVSGLCQFDPSQRWGMSRVQEWNHANTSTKHIEKYDQQVAAIIELNEVNLELKEVVANQLDGKGIVLVDKVNDKFLCMYNIKYDYYVTFIVQHGEVIDALTLLRDEVSESGATAAINMRLTALGVSSNEDLLDLCTRHPRRDEYRRELLGYVRPGQQGQFQKLLAAAPLKHFAVAKAGTK